MAVLKQAGFTGSVRSLAGRPVAVPMPEDEASRLRAERAALAGELADVRDRAARAADAARAAIAKAREDGVAEGRRAGIASVERSETKRIAAVCDGIAGETARFAERLETLDALAAALARACLDRVFARPDAMAAMVVDALEHRLSLLRAGTVLTVRVSGADFVDGVALAAAVRGAGSDAVVTIDAALPSGACRIGARLGQVDLDVPGQWTAIAGMLDGMAEA